MTEWPKVHDWKSCVVQATEGSNPSLSATLSIRNQVKTTPLSLCGRYSVGSKASYLVCDQSFALCFDYENMV